MDIWWISSQTGLPAGFVQNSLGLLIINHLNDNELGAVIAFNPIFGATEYLDRSGSWEAAPANVPEPYPLLTMGLTVAVAGGIAWMRRRTCRHAS